LDLLKNTVDINLGIEWILDSGMTWSSIFKDPKKHKSRGIQESCETLHIRMQPSKLPMLNAFLIPQFCKMPWETKGGYNFLKEYISSFVEQLQ
jgi:hypothetical protein